MATVTISAEDLQSVYSQLNFLRNYVGVWSLDWKEHVVTAAVAVPAAAAVATSVAVNAASVAVPATSKPTVAAAIGSPVAKSF
jgi:hypothetical protein